MTARRLGGGRLIDREKPLRFTFNGRKMTGYQGDTLASALLANGQTLVGRSFKYSRPARASSPAGAGMPNSLGNASEGTSVFDPVTPRVPPPPSFSYGLERRARYHFGRASSSHIGAR